MYSKLPNHLFTVLLHSTLGPYLDGYSNVNFESIEKEDCEFVSKLII